MSDKLSRSRINEFNGINPILNGLCQAFGDRWRQFHQFHIFHLYQALSLVLEDTGYEAVLSPSLQIFDADDSTHSRRARRPDPDISIRQQPDRLSAHVSNSATVSSATLELSLDEALNLAPENYPSAIVVRRQLFEPIADDLGMPVVWIELISATNKPGSTHHRAYQEKRRDVIASDQVLVEIDYLHQTRPVITRIPRYTATDTSEIASGAAPYYVAITDPHRTRADLYQFQVEEPLPTVPIALSAQLNIPFYLNAAYNATLYGGYGGGAGKWLDYSQLPIDFDTFSRADQDRIAARLLTLADAQVAGQLQSEHRIPLPLSVPIDGAAARWQA